MLKIQGMISPEFYDPGEETGQISMKVHGLFSKAVYLLSPSGKLYLLHDAKYGLIPFGIAVVDFERLIRVQMSLQEGDEGILCENRLYFPNRVDQTDGRSGEYRIVLTLSKVCSISQEQKNKSRRLVDSKDRTVFRMPKPEKLKEATVYWKRVLLAVGKGSMYNLLTDMSADLFAKAAKEPMTLLQDSLIHNDGEGIGDALSRLCGLGQGLTPSADDCLNGILYVLWYWKRAFGIDLPGRTDMSCWLLQHAPHRTNVYSSAYLTATASGKYYSLYEAFLHPDDFMNETDGNTILSIGASSGADILTGMILGISLLCFDRSSLV